MKKNHNNFKHQLVVGKGEMCKGLKKYKIDKEVATNLKRIHSQVFSFINRHCLNLGIILTDGNIMVI